MTLDEAIKHYDDLADYDCYNDEQFERSKEWFQVAEWLKELRKLRSEQVDCEYCHEDSDGYVSPIEKIRTEIMSKDGLEEALEIIDKYTAENEGME